MAPKSDIKHQNCLHECYNTQSLSPPSKGEVDNIRCKNSKCNLLKSVWQHANELIILILAVQLTAVHSLEDNATNNSRLGVELADQPIKLHTLIGVSQIFTCNTSVLPSVLQSRSSNFVRDTVNFDNTDQYVHDTETCDEYKTDINELSKSLDSLNLQLKEEIKSLCISEIGNGHIETAVKKFKELNDFDNDHLIRDIINKAYTYNGQPNNLENIIDFIAQLPWISQMVISYEALYDNIERNSYKLFIFVTQVEKTKGLCTNAKELIPRLDDLRSKATLYVDKSIDAWALQIRNKNYREILKFSRTYMDAFDSNLCRLIEKTYANDLSNAENIIEFTRNLPTIHSSIISLDCLFNQMKNHGNDLDSSELLMLAYYAKELMAMKNYYSVSQSYKDQLMAIKDNLPDSVRRLIWGGSDCTLRNRVYKEYLYAANAGYARDGERRNTYTLRTGNVNYESHWKVTPQQYGKFFSIQNTYYNNEYLYAAANDLAYDSERRSVYTWRPKSEVAEWTYWRLVPVNNAEYFIIQYKDYYYEYLYPGWNKLVRDATARYIFTWRKTEETPTKEGHWYINC